MKTLIEGNVFRLDLRNEVSAFGVEELFRALVRAIGLATKRSSKMAWNGIVRACRWLDQEWTKGLEMNRRYVLRMNEGHAKNWYYIRSAL